jgi:hypothetical protein
MPTPTNYASSPKTCDCHPTRSNTTGNSTQTDFPPELYPATSHELKSARAETPLNPAKPEDIPGTKRLLRDLARQLATTINMLIS